MISIIVAFILTLLVLFAYVSIYRVEVEKFNERRRKAELLFMYNNALSCSWCDEFIEEMGKHNLLGSVNVSKRLVSKDDPYYVGEPTIVLIKPTGEVMTYFGGNDVDKMRVFLNDNRIVVSVKEKRGGSGKVEVEEYGKEKVDVTRGGRMNVLYFIYYDEDFGNLFKLMINESIKVFPNANVKFVAISKDDDIAKSNKIYVDKMCCIAGLLLYKKNYEVVEVPPELMNDEVAFKEFLDKHGVDLGEIVSEENLVIDEETKKALDAALEKVLVKVMNGEVDLSKFVVNI